MRVDIDGVTEIVGLAAEFDWTGSKEDLGRFCEAARWTIIESWPLGADIATDLDIDRPEGHAFFGGGRLSYIAFEVSDLLSKEQSGDGTLSRACFDDLSDSLFRELGEPDYGVRRTETSYFRWDLPKVVIFANCRSRYNSIRLVERSYQEKQDFIDKHIIGRRDEI
ncbi:DUF6301 family protein [Nocardia xishanensis]|uniref:DUF6301 family protein n=1 Tax=Nocardia xishanensis TaxID=238964 RepID=UPI0034090065